MTQFAAYTIIGLSLGGIFALAALGIVLIYRVTGVLNFAHGAMGMFSTFVAWQVFYGTPHTGMAPWMVTAEAIGAGLLFAVVLGLVLAFGLAAFLRGTAFGRAMRAVSDDPTAASLWGVRVDMVGAVSWMLGSLIAAVAGILITPFINFDTTSLTLLIVDSLAAALIGGLVSLPMTVLGGFLLGLLETYPTMWIQSLGLPRLIALLVILAVLILRSPRGLPAVAK